MNIDRLRSDLRGSSRLQSESQEFKAHITLGIFLSCEVFLDNWIVDINPGNVSIMRQQ